MIFRQKLGRAACAGAAVLAVALTGCSGGGQSAGAPDGGIVQMYGGASGQLTENYNPLSPTSLEGVRGLIFEPLFYFNQLAALDDEPLPVLGESFEFNEDGTVLTVQTKTGVEWSDGEAFSAEDVAFTVNLIRANPELDVTGNTPAGEATGENEVTLTFDRPSFTDGPNILGGTYIVPEHIWSEIDDPVTNINADPVGSGPFSLGEFTAQSYVLEKSDSYREADDIAPEGARYFSLSGNEAATDRFLAGDLDLAGIFIPDVDQVLEPFPDLHTSPGPDNFLVLNTCANAELGCVGPQTDPIVRQALALAVGRDQISELAYFGRASEISPTFVDLEANADLIADEFSDATYTMEPDVEGAQALLEGDGWTAGSDGVYEKDGQRLSLEILVTTGYTDYIATLEVLTQQLGDAGIELNTSEIANAENVSKRGLGDYQLGIDGMFPGPINDPYYYYAKYFGSAGVVPVGESGDPYGNVSRFSNPVVDEALAAAAATTDVEEKAAAFARIQAEIVPNLPYIPMLAKGNFGVNSTANWEGFPSDEDPYSEGADAGLAVIMATIEPR